MTDIPEKQALEKALNDYITLTWNSAIEKAAKELEKYSVMNRANEIRKLKR